MRLLDMKQRMVLITFLLISSLCMQGNVQLKMTVREAAMLDEINYARTKPAEYAVFIDEYLTTTKASTAEKVVAKELYKVLTTMKPVQALEFSPYLYKHAVLHGQWIARTGIFEHSDFDFNYGENLVGGTEDVRHSVIDLLIDHGIPSRGHRINILLPKYKYGAVYEIPGSVSMFEFIFIQMFSSQKHPEK